ncbi:Segregation and condensation protein B [Deinococcus deserti]
MLRELESFSDVLSAADLGFRVEVVAGGYRLVVPGEVAAQLSPLLAPPPLPALSSAALEVLAVIAYRQPVTRAEIEAMRGGSASTVVTLQERELVKVVGRSDAVGQPLLYGTTERFLMEFGLAGLGDLPPLDGADFSHLLRG